MSSSSSSCLSLLLILALTAVHAQVEICGHDHFDIKTLKRQPQWFFRVPDAKFCAGAEANVQAECYAYFSICGPLPEGECNHGNGTGFCQVVTSGQIHQAYDTGKATILIDETAENNGFQISYRNGTNTSTCVNDTTSTFVFFQCDRNAQWNVYDPNITRFMDGFIYDPLDPCIYLVTFNYSGACIAQKPIFPHICDLDGYDLQTLSQPPSWVAQQPSSHCYGLSVPETTCELIFSFCKALPGGQCYNSVFCQQGTHPYSFGEYNHDVKVVKNEDGLGFTMTYTNGTQTAECPAGFFSTLIFTCDLSAVWSTDDTEVTNITKFITAAEPSFSDCEYIVRFNYSGACSSTPFPPPNVVGGSKQSPVGWILMGIFFGVVILYLVVGVVIQGVRGKRGVELMPNHDFWRAVLVYILEGCQVTMDFVTCYKFRETKLLTSKKTDYESL